MKANNGTGNNTERDEWQTPDDLYHDLDMQYGFTFDCCANEKNNKTYYYSTDFTKEDPNNLQYHICFMNPPFSKAKEMIDYFLQHCTGIIIYRCDNLETSIWQDIILPKASWIHIPKGRIHYTGMKGKGSRFPTAIIGKGIDYPHNVEGRTLL